MRIKQSDIDTDQDAIRELEEKVGQLEKTIERYEQGFMQLKPGKFLGKLQKNDRLATVYWANENEVLLHAYGRMSSSFQATLDNLRLKNRQVAQLEELLAAARQRITELEKEVA